MLSLLQILIYLVSSSGSWAQAVSDLFCHGLAQKVDIDLYRVIQFHGAVIGLRHKTVFAHLDIASWFGTAVCRISFWYSI